MKKYSLTLFILLVFKYGFSQTKLSILGGVRQATVIESNNLAGWDSIKAGFSPVNGIHAGLMADIQASKKYPLYFQAAIIYTAKGRSFSAKYNPKGIASLKDSNFKQNLNYIELPLNIVYKIKLGKTMRFVVGAGPYLSFFLSGKENSIANYYPVDSNAAITTVSFNNTNLSIGKGAGKYRTTDVGVNVLAGIEGKKFGIMAWAGQSITTMYQSVNYKGIFKNRVWGVTLKINLNDKTATPTDAIPTPAPMAPVNTQKELVADTDGDGINDKDDKCPGIKGIAKYAGCPVPDTDNDGVNDEADKCPTEAGIAENNGCPLIVQKPVMPVTDTAHYIIYFDVNKGTLNTKMLKVLQKLATILQKDSLLQANIEGYTDNAGNDEANLKLSSKRAQAVSAYLLSKQIATNRLTIAAFGKQKPVTSFTNPLLQWKNRRVEIYVYKKY
jgi:OmpA-OmpF porin, OOP family